jgi:DNA-binding helix-hairpin-helix protein with protein kinase domain
LIISPNIAVNGFNTAREQLAKCFNTFPSMASITWQNSIMNCPFCLLEQRTRAKYNKNIIGNAYIIESCSKITACELKEVRNVTCWPLMPYAFGIKRLGNPSAKFL